MSEEQPQSPWQEDIFNVLKQGNIRQVAYVPDAGHAHVIRRVHAEPSMRGIVLTTEEEGVAITSGAWLGGERAALVQRLGLNHLYQHHSLPSMYVAHFLCQCRLL